MGKEYTVLSIDELVKPGEAGGIERFYRHRIKTKGGVILGEEKAWRLQL